MKTNDLISRLSADVQPMKGAESSLRFFLLWALAACGMTALWLVLLPLRADLEARAFEPGFLFEGALWLALAAGSALIVYRSRIPSLESSRLQGLMIGLAIGLAIYVLAHVNFASLQNELAGEMDLFRGRCGPLIFSMGLVWGAGLLYYAKRGAPTQLASTGAWAAVSAGALASLAMQAVCAYENPAHLLIWHFLPVFALTFVGAQVGQRFLRW